MIYNITVQTANALTLYTLKHNEKPIHTILIESIIDRNYSGCNMTCKTLKEFLYKHKCNFSNENRRTRSWKCPEKFKCNAVSKDFKIYIDHLKTIHKISIRAANRMNSNFSSPTAINEIHSSSTVIIEIHKCEVCGLEGQPQGGAWWGVFRRCR